MVQLVLDALKFSAWKCLYIVRADIDHYYQKEAYSKHTQAGRSSENMLAQHFIDGSGQLRVVEWVPE